MRANRTLTLGLLVASGLLLNAGEARANGFEFPSNGTEQFGRGGAWVARADDPLATFFNPAALSRNSTAVSLTVNLGEQKTCFDRSYNGQPVQIGTGGQAQTYSQACSTPSLFPNPQLAASFRLSPKLGIGIAVLGPSAIGNPKFPDTTINPSATVSPFTGMPTGMPQSGPSAARYLLTSASPTILWPQVGIGYEVAPNLRIGASFIWGLAFLKIGNVSPGATNAQTVNPTTGQLTESGQTDVGANITAKDLFIPGVTASAMYTAADMLDIAYWFHWSGAVSATGNTSVSSFYEDSTVSKTSLPVNASPAVQNTASGQTTVSVPQPWEMKLGFRFYKKRSHPEAAPPPPLLPPPTEGAADPPAPPPPVEPAPAATSKDPMHDEVFDIELDGEFDHDSSFDNLRITFGNPPLTLNPTGGAMITAVLPSTINVPHMWKDSFGLRLGGDYNVIADRLALRAGLWLQTASMRPEYLNLDFMSQQREGFNVGLTVRLHLTETMPLDLQGGYGHIFFSKVDNGGVGSLLAPVTGAAPNTSLFAVNGGSVTSSANVASLGVVLRFQ